VIVILPGIFIIFELCRHEGIISNLYYHRTREFLEAGKKHLVGCEFFKLILREKYLLIDKSWRLLDFWKIDSSNPRFLSLLMRNLG